MAEWLFDDHPCPAVVFFLGQAAFAQLLDDRREESRCDRQIEESVSERVLKLVSLFNLLFQPFVGLGVLKISPDVIDSLGDPVPELQVDSCAKNNPHAGCCSRIRTGDHSRNSLSSSTKRLLKL